LLNGTHSVAVLSTDNVCFIGGDDAAHAPAQRRLPDAERRGGHSFYDVRNRLRHASIQTTERVYGYLDWV